MLKSKASPIERLPVESLLAQFLGRPYVYEPLGEGAMGTYSTRPLYRTDQFDCVTFVNTILAMAYSSDVEKHILPIRYINSKIAYIHRTDWFTDLEWNPNARKLGYIEDITDTICNKYEKPIAKNSYAVINKPQFYANKTEANIDLPNINPQQRALKLLALRAEGKQFSSILSKISYLPLTSLFDKNNDPEIFIWEQLPKLSIIQSVRPGWRPINPLDQTIDYGTSLNVSHIGIALRTRKDILFYHASSEKGCVVQVPLIEYYKRFLSSSEKTPVSGFHVERVLV